MNRFEAERRYIRLMRRLGAATAATIAQIQTLADVGRLTVGLLGYTTDLAERLPAGIESRYLAVLLAQVRPGIRKRYRELTQPGLPDGPE